MKLLTDEIRKKLRANNIEQQPVRGTTAEIDHWPVVKLFTPDGGCTWLLTELEDDGDTAFGLCDLGMDSPELGYVLISELTAVRGGFGKLPVERDLHFKATKPLSQYADEARARGCIAA
jgi:hypothetical protein